MVGTCCKHAMQRRVTPPASLRTPSPHLRPAVPGVKAGSALCSVPKHIPQLVTPRNAVVSRAAVEDCNLYPGDGGLGDYPAPKPTTPALTNAGAGFLTWVTLVHYIIFPMQLGVSYAIWSNTAFFAPQVSNLFLVLMTPIFQGLAGVGPIVMHEYEGWQIAPFECAEQPGSVDPRKANNEGLRREAYRFLFAMQAVSAIMMIVGVWGLDKWSVTIPIIDKTLQASAPVPAIIIGAVLVALYTAPRNNLFTVPFAINGQTGLVPVPWRVFIIFIAAVTVYAPALVHVNGGHWLITMIIILMNVGGGLIEGLMAESTFNQWWHFVAVIFLNGGGALQIWWISKMVAGL